MNKLIIVFFSFYSINLIAQQQKTFSIYPFGTAEKWGIITYEKEVVVKPKYDSIGFFYGIDRVETTAILKKKGKFGFIDGNGKIVLKPKYEEIATVGYLARSYQKVRKGNTWGLVNRSSGDFILKPEYEEIERFEGRESPATYVKKNEKYGVFNLEKGFLTMIEYDEILVYDTWDEIIFELKKGDETSYIDNEGKTIDDPYLEEDMPQFMDQDVMETPSVEPNEKITKLGNQKFEVSFGYEVRNQQGYKTYIDTIESYDEVLEIKVAKGRYLSDSNIPVFYVVVEKNGKKGMLGENGKVITPVEYDGFEESKNSIEYMYLIKGDLKGVVNRYTGIRILDAEFTAIKLNYGGLFFVVHQNGYFGYANSNGEVFLPVD